MFFEQIVHDLFALRVVCIGECVDDCSSRGAVRMNFHGHLLSVLMI